jgi:uroporphyrinogen-III synthase
MQIILFKDPPGSPPDEYQKTLSDHLGIPSDSLRYISVLSSTVDQDLVNQVVHDYISNPHTAFVVTSARAGTPLGMALSRICPSEVVPRVFAVGKATARAVQLAGAPAETQFHLGTGNGAQLAGLIEEWHRQAPATHWVVLQGNQALQDIPTMLQKLGAKWIQKIVYDVQARPALEIQRELYSVKNSILWVFFSPSGVNAVIPDLKPTGPLAAIGETTAQRLRELGYEPLVATSPTPVGLAAVISPCISSLHSQ